MSGAIAIVADEIINVGERKAKSSAVSVYKGAKKGFWTPKVGTPAYNDLYAKGGGKLKRTYPNYKTPGKTSRKRILVRRTGYKRRYKRRYRKKTRTRYRRRRRSYY